LLHLDRKITASFDTASFEKLKLNYDVDMVVSRALHYSSGLERDLEMLREKRDLQELKASGLPVISLSVGGGVNSQAEEIRELTGLKSNSLSALVSISIPILSWNENRLKANLAEESARIRSVEHRQKCSELEMSYRGELNNLEYVLSSLNNDKHTLELLYLKYDQLLANYEQGRVDYLDLADTRHQITELEIERIRKIKSFYMTVYNFRRYALYDIMCNEDLT
jgi:outer membrane protein TolC